jgi:inosine-uridine nucleoside N-ribohydrolase
MSTSLIIDCDPGHDDAIAILLALASPELDVRGVTTVAGNQTIDWTTRNALHILQFAGREDIGVAQGAAAPLRHELRTAQNVHGLTGLDGASELPRPTASPVGLDAASYLATNLRPGTTLTAIGPLTNVALALRRGARPDRLVWMGGGLSEGDFTEVAEFNAYVDPDAAAEVFAAGLRPTMVGLDVTHRALISPAHRERIRAAGTAGRFVAQLLDYYGGGYRDRYGWDSSPVHDALAVAVTIDPSFVECEHAHVRVHTDGAERGRTERIDDLPPNVDVALRVDDARFAEFVCSRLERLP